MTLPKAALHPFQAERPVYLVLGPETWIAEAGLDLLRHRLQPCSVVRATSIRAAEAESDTYALDGQHKLVALLSYDVPDAASERRAELDALQRIGARSRSDASTVLIHLLQADRRVAVFRDLVRQGLASEAPQPRRGELQSWVYAIAQHRQAEITDGAAHLLASVAATDLMRLDQEIQKLQVYADGPIGSGDVQAVAEGDVNVSVWEMTEAFGAKDVRRVLADVLRLLAQGESAIGLVALLARELRLIWQAKSRPQGEDMVRLPPPAVQRLQASARRWSVAELRDGLRACLETDLVLKRGADERTALALLITGSIIARASAG